MKSLFGSVLCVLLIANQVAFAQETPVNKDSLNRETVVVSPDLATRTASKQTGYIVSENTPNRFQGYAGVSVLNNLRGSLPSFTISPDITEIKSHNIRTALRRYSGNSMLVIDGMPLHHNVIRYYNLNSFEFEKITAVSSGGSTAVYGGLGSNGGLFLDSKSGQGMTRPLFEFNSHSTVYMEDEIERYYHESPAKIRSVFSNSIAYSKDWGAVDMRVSYNHSTSPNYGGHKDGFQRANSLKLNTGWQAGKKFTARFIGDLRREKSLIEIPGGAPTLSSSNDRIEGSTKYSQGNLTMKYALSPKLKIISLNVYSDANSDVHKRFFSYPFGTAQDKQLHNLIVAYSNLFSENISVNVYGGMQYEKFGYRRSNGPSYESLRSKTNSILGGFDANISDIVILNAAFRREAIDNPVRTKISTASSGSAGITLMISRALNIAPEKFGAKIRSSIGRSGYSYWKDYPVFEPNYQLQPPAAPRVNIEAGADLSFLGNKITCSFNYFEVIDQEVWSSVLEPQLTIIFSYGEFHNRGMEAVIKVTPLNTPDTRFQSTLMFYKRNEEFQPSALKPEAYDGTYFSGTLPDAEASLLSELTLKNLFISLLVDARKGEDFSVFTYYGPSVNLEGSFAKLRALTIGYAFPSDTLKKLHIEGAKVSLTGMNLWQTHDHKKDPDAYMTPVAGLNKTVSLSLSLQF